MRFPLVPGSLAGKLILPLGCWLWMILVSAGRAIRILSKPAGTRLSGPTLTAGGHSKHKPTTGCEVPGARWTLNLLAQGNGFLQTNIRRGSPDPQFELSGFQDQRVAIHVPLPQRLGGQREGDAPAFARGEGHALEAA